MRGLLGTPSNKKLANLPLNTWELRHPTHPLSPHHYNPQRGTQLPPNRAKHNLALRKEKLGIIGVKKMWICSQHSWLYTRLHPLVDSFFMLEERADQNGNASRGEPSTWRLLTPLPSNQKCLTLPWTLKSTWLHKIISWKGESNWFGMKTTHKPVRSRPYNRAKKRNLFGPDKRREGETHSSEGKANLENDDRKRHLLQPSFDGHVPISTQPPWNASTAGNLIGLRDLTGGSPALRPTHDTLFTERPFSNTVYTAHTLPQPNRLTPFDRYKATAAPEPKPNPYRFIQRKLNLS